MRARATPHSRRPRPRLFPWLPLSRLPSRRISRTTPLLPSPLAAHRQLTQDLHLRATTTTRRRTLLRTPFTRRACLRHSLRRRQPPSPPNDHQPDIVNNSSRHLLPRHRSPRCAVHCRLLQRPTLLPRLDSSPAFRDGSQHLSRLGMYFYLLFCLYSSSPALHFLGHTIPLSQSRRRVVSRRHHELVSGLIISCLT